MNELNWFHWNWNEWRVGGERNVLIPRLGDCRCAAGRWSALTRGFRCATAAVAEWPSGRTVPCPVAPCGSSAPYLQRNQRVSIDQCHIGRHSVVTHPPDNLSLNGATLPIIRIFWRTVFKTQDFQTTCGGVLIFF